MRQYPKGTEIKLKDGRIFNSRFSNKQTAIYDVKQYLFCEYGERIEENDIESVKEED